MNEQSHKVLLVEDEVLIAMAEKQQLEKIGYAVDHVLTGEAAVSSALDADSQPDLILMDINLGNGIDGTEAARRILNEIDIPIVFLSSHADPEVVERTEKIPSYGYVVKNAGTPVLDTSIKTAVRLFDEKRKLATSKEENYRLFETIPPGQSDATIEDITAWKQTEKEPKYQNLLLRRLFDSSVDLISITDLEGNYIKISEAHKILGYDNDYLVGRNFKDFIHPEDASFVERVYSEAVDSCDTPMVSYRIRRYNGEYLWFESTGRVLTDGNAFSEQVLLNSRHITERKRAEEKMQRLLSEKETLLKEVHHRIKNNMAQVESLLRIQADSINEAEAKSALSVAISRIHSISKLYESLIVGNRHEEVSMKEYLESLIDSLVEVFTESPGVTIETSIVDLVLSSKKAILVGIIVNELLTNVFKYAFVGRVEGRVSIKFEKVDTRIRLVVQDDGVGVNEGFPANESTGFGLALVKMLAEQLCGTYTIENNNGTINVLEFEI